MRITRTHSKNTDFQMLTKDLDADLQIRDRDEHPFYAQYNKVDEIKYVVVVYEEDEAIGCGAIKEYAPGIMEVKRMFVPPDQRGKGIASIVLNELETWSLELGFSTCILETGIKQTEAIRLYEKNQYTRIPNYGQYADAVNSVCFEKALVELQLLNSTSIGQ